MAKMFKDFNKDVKDLLTKNYTPTGTWKMESKMKGTKNSIIVNPKADAKGVNVDVEFKCPLTGLDTKTNINHKGVVNPKLTYKANGHKVEVAMADLKLDAGLASVVYEGTVAGIVIYDKVTTKALEAGASYQVVPQVAVGGQIVVDAKKQELKDYQLGLLYADKGYVVALTTKNLKTFTSGALAPFSFGDYKAKAAVQVDCGKGKATGKVGLECNVCPCVQIKISATNAGEVAMAFVHKFSTGWKAATTMELHHCWCKLGLSLTLE